MQDEFRCQNPACGVLIEGRNRMCDDPATGCLVIVCPRCKAKHVEVEDLSLPGAGARIRFQLLPGSIAAGIGDGGVDGGG